MVASSNALLGAAYGPSTLSTGAGTAYAVTINPLTRRIVDGQAIAFRAHAANTNAATLTVQTSFGPMAAPLKKAGRNGPRALRRGEVVAGQQLLATYDSVLNIWQILSYSGDQNFSVRDFGAMGDGVTNDAAAIQVAVDAVLAAPNGGTLTFSEGLYLQGARVNIPKTSGKRITIKFDAGAVIQNVVGYADHLLYVGSATVPAGGSGVTFEGLAIRGNGPCRGAIMENANLTRFINSNFTLMEIGVEMSNSHGVKFEGCVFDVGAFYSIYSSTAAHHTVITNTNFYTTGTAGVYTVYFAGASDNLVIRDSDAEGCWSFLGMLAGGTALTFEGNYVEYCSNTPFFFNAPMYGASIRNNWIGLSGVLALNNIAGGAYENNSSYNQTVTVSATTVSGLSWAGNKLTGTGSLQYSDRTLVGPLVQRPNPGGQDVVHRRGLAPTGAVAVRYFDHTDTLRWTQAYDPVSWSLFAGATPRLVLTDTGRLQPGADSTGGLGATGARWNALFVNPPVPYGSTTHIVGLRSSNGEAVQIAIAGEFASNAAAVTAGVALGDIYFDTGSSKLRART